MEESLKPFDAHCYHMGTAIKHLVPDWVRRHLYFLISRQCEATFILIRVRVRVPSPGFSLRLVQASPARVSVQGHLYNTIQYNIRLLKLDRMQAQQYG